MKVLGPEWRALSAGQGGDWLLLYQEWSDDEEFKMRLPWGHSSWWEPWHGNIKDLEYFCPFVDRTLMHCMVSMLDTGWQLQQFTCFVFCKWKIYHFWNKMVLKKLGWNKTHLYYYKTFQHSKVVWFEKYNFNHLELL